MDIQLDALEQARATLIDMAIKFGPRVAVAILIMVAGVVVGRWVATAFSRSITKFGLEPPLQLLMVRVVRVLVLALFLIMALQNLGVELLPLIAGLGVAGAGVALAMQGVLGNLVAGLTIIFTRPFRVGEYVSMLGVEGRVESIDLFSTTLSHADCSTVVVPNRKIVGEILHNYGSIRQLDLSVGVARAAELERALVAVNEAVGENVRVLADPAAVVGVKVLADQSIVIAVKPWVNVPDYQSAAAEINLAIVEKFRAAGIDYPVSLREMRLVDRA